MECFGEKKILAHDLVLLDFWDVTQLEVRNPTTKSIGFARREELREERLGTFVQSIHSSLVSIKPLFRSPQERERKQTAGLHLAIQS